MKATDYILEEAVQRGMGEQLIEMVNSIKENLTDINMIDLFDDEAIYKEAFNTCVHPPEYFDYYGSWGEINSR